jgi:anti-sigma factor (TIGR02949 family)
MKPLSGRDMNEIDCRSFLSRLPDLLDGEVDGAERPRLDAHLDHCAHCLATFRFERAILDGLRGKLAAAAMPDEFGRRVLSLIDRQMAGGGG